MKFSRQREMILREVQNSIEHPTADNIYDSLKKDNPNLSLGTVYRNLTQLEENGYISKIAIPGDPIRFDANLNEHHHFICEKCNKIIDIDNSSIEYIENPLIDKGIKIKSRFIVLRGICDKCSENE